MCMYSNYMGEDVSVTPLAIDHLVQVYCEGCKTPKRITQSTLFRGTFKCRECGCRECLEAADIGQASPERIMRPRIKRRRLYVG